ncbi:MAG: hypothetical protein ACFFBP_05400 [Promethearchaeota archaeon]
MIREYDFYSFVFNNYLQLEKNLDAETKDHFFEDSIYKLIEVTREIESEVFFQNAMLIIACLYHDRNIDKYDYSGKDINDLNTNEKHVAYSIIKKAIE